MRRVCCINRCLGAGTLEKVSAGIMGGVAVCTVREELSRVVKRLKDKNAIKKFGGECECVGDADHPVECKSVPSNLSHRTSSRSGVGRGRS